MRAGFAAVQVLRDRGVRYAFCVPGESFLGVLDGLALTPEIQLIASRHEGGAAFMADAVGKLTGQPAICMGTRGVGSANLAIGIHTAQQDSTPMIAIVGQVETPERHREAFQEVELAQFLGPITKWTVDVPEGPMLPRIAAEAYRRSMAGRPGPIAIATRGDILDQEAEEPLPPVTAISRSPANADDIRRAIEVLRGAGKPVIIAGAGVLRAQASALLREFAEHTSIPVMSAFRRMDVFPNRHPLYVGAASFASSAAVRQRAREADVVLAIGTRLSEMTTFAYTVPAPGATLIHIDISPEETGKAMPSAIAMAADAGLALRQLLDAAGPAWPDRGERFSPEQLPATAVNGVEPALVAAAMDEQLPDHAVLTSDAGNFFGWVSRGYRFRQPGTFIGPTSGAMGYSVPAAVAASLVRGRETPVVATAGDGGFLMNGNELATAALLDLPVKCVVFNNGIYGTIRLHQERAYPGRIAATNLQTPDLIKYAESFGGIGVRVERNEDIRDGLREVLSSPGIGILDVVVDPDTISVGTRLSTLARSS